MKRRIRTVLSVFLAVSTMGMAEEPFAFEKTPGALPKTVVPQRYRVVLAPDATALTTRGSVEVDVAVSEPVNEIRLHAADLKITGAVLNAETDLVAKVEDQILTLTPPEPVEAGEHTVRLEFEGKINARPSGLYHVDYPVDGKTERMLVTQMEPADCRSVIPCWDEPVFRAVFELTLVIPGSRKAFSNMPVASRVEDEAGMKSVRFEPTPSMSTYLLAFATGDLEVLQGEADGVELGIITPAGKREQGRYAMEVTRKVIPFFHEYFGVRYPLPKLDQIAVPNKGGAMENWGLITYGESSLLFDEGRSSQYTRERIFEIIAHEIAHQWFGNLVTMAWWDNLWLNEGFASWMATKTTDHFNPEWQIWLRSHGGKEWAMSRDSRRTTHPIQQPVATVGEALDMFDAISYQKGQAFIRMLEDALGENAFREGLRAYMSEHAYSNTTTADLWNALETASGEKVRSMAGGWTEQAGFPLIAVERDGGRLAFSQGRFTIGEWDQESVTWEIPVRLVSVEDPDQTKSFSLEKANGMIELDGAWKANAGGAGFYRTRYSRELADQITSDIQMLPAADRLNLLGDSWAMFLAGRARLESCLTLVEKLGGDTNQAVVDQVIGILDSIDSGLRESPLRKPFREFARGMIVPQFERLGWEAVDGEPATDGVLRSRVIEVLGKWEDPEVVPEAEKRFRAFLADRSTLAPDLRWPVLTTVGRGADAETYEALTDLARSTENSDERGMFFHALCMARDPALAGKTLELSLDESLPANIATRLVSNVSWAGEHPSLAWEFATENFASINARLGALWSNDYFPRLATMLLDADAAGQLKAFRDRHLGKPQEQAVERALSNIAIDTEFRARLKGELAELPTASPAAD